MGTARTAASRPRFFSRDIRPGTPICAEGIAAGLRKIENALANIEVVGGRAEWRNGRLRIIIGE